MLVFMAPRCRRLSCCDANHRRRTSEIRRHCSRYSWSRCATPVAAAGSGWWARVRRHEGATAVTETPALKKCHPGAGPPARKIGHLGGAPPSPCLPRSQGPHIGMRVKPGSQALMNSSRSVPVDARMTLTPTGLGWSLCTVLSPGVAVSVAVKPRFAAVTHNHNRRSERSRCSPSADL